jgi:hypothetical protein
MLKIVLFEFFLLLTFLILRSYQVLSLIRYDTKIVTQMKPYHLDFVCDPFPYVHEVKWSIIQQEI